MGFGTADEPARAERAASRTWVALAAYTVLFVAAAWPWLRAAADSVPRTSFSNRSDERLIAYILAWGAHALADRSAALFAMPINYPAPHQLAGSEHFLSAQLVFAPVFWWSGNAVLAANAAVFATYPLGAAAMYWLVQRLGGDRLVAFAAGLALALGAGQLPAHLHLLQYPVLYLPLVAGMLTQVRLVPDARRVAGLALVCLLAFFSSYYACVLSALVAVLWALAELCRRRPGRVAFVVRTGLAIGIPALLLGVFSRPYFARPEAAALGTESTMSTHGAALFLAGVYSQTSGVLLRVLSVCGLAALWSRVPAARISARRGLLCAAAGGVLMLGPGLPLADGTLPLPYAALAASPLGFFRYPHRFIAVVAFGRALLLAGALQAVRGWLPSRLGTALVLAASAAIVMTRAPRLGAGPYDVIEALHVSIYPVIATVARSQGGGALLELPITPPADGRIWTEGDALIGQTRHWVPLIGGHTGYQPPHRGLVMSAVQRLPAPDAIQFLVDTTHVRWVLLRPEEQWPEGLRRQRAAIEGAPWASRVSKRAGWLLLRVGVKPRRLGFFDEVARGWRPGETALGTPVAPVPANEARASVTGRLPRTARSDSAQGVRLVITNDGHATWPVSVPTFGGSWDSPYAGEVWLRAAWHRLAPAGEPVEFDVALPRDVRGGEILVQRFRVPTPAEPGTYDLDLAIRQRSGEGFAAPASRSLRGRIEVVAPPAAVPLPEPCQ